VGFEGLYLLALFVYGIILIVLFSCIGAGLMWLILHGYVLYSVCIIALLAATISYMAWNSLR